MNNEILWLIRLCVDGKMFTREQAVGVLKAIGRDAQLMDFAQKLIDDGIVTDVDTLERVAGNAMARAALGPPDGNPLLEGTTPPMPVGDSSGSRPPVKAGPAGAPQFPFDQIASMDDAALAKAMRQLLIDAGKYEDFAAALRLVRGTAALM